MTPEQREAHSQRMKALWADPEYREAQSLRLKALRSERRGGRVRPEAKARWRANISAGIRADYERPGRRENQAALNRALAADPVWLAKNAEANWAKARDPEWQAKHSAMVASREWQEKCAAGMRARWAEGQDKTRGEVAHVVNREIRRVALLHGFIRTARGPTSTTFSHPFGVVLMAHPFAVWTLSGAITASGNGWRKLKAALRPVLL